MADSKPAQPQTTSGQQLYRLLPAVYRNRDNGTPLEAGDLAKYLDACGGLLDQVRATLDQRLADSFPDNPDTGAACQDWLLPYFAQLVDVTLYAPDADGQRDEVGNAVLWRQRKGTRVVTEQIAEALGRIEVVNQEGWKRLAMTARVDRPLLPPEHFGVFQDYDPTIAIEQAQHPGIPATTIDFRSRSHAVRTEASNPAAQHSSFDGEQHYWRQHELHGAPCYPGSYQDVSRRTVDVRVPDYRRGHYHPERVLLYYAAPQGFFQTDWQDLESSTSEDIIFDSDELHVLEDRIVDANVLVSAGRLLMTNCAVRNLEVNGGGDPDVAAVQARNCLFETVSSDGLAQLEYCTVLQSAVFEWLNASDCIFPDDMQLSGDVLQRRSCVRYSRIAPDFNTDLLLYFGERVETNSRETPVYFGFAECQEQGDQWLKMRRPAEFGEAGCAVIHPAAPRSVCFGAEDGGEMGVYHPRHYCLRHQATLDKLSEFLPVGMEPVLIPDQQLSVVPPDEQDLINEESP